MTALGTMQHLVVLLEHRSVPFCSYAAAGGGDKRIDLDVLREVAAIAVKNGISLNVVYGAGSLPPGHEEVIAGVEHMKIVPAGHGPSSENAIVVIDGQKDLRHLATLEEGAPNNIILRTPIAGIPSLGAVVRALMGRFKRLNVIMTDVADMTREDMDAYRRELDIVRELFEDEYRKGTFPETNILTDRVFLTNMNNCNAGVTHLTVAPNGRIYLCPAFYYHDEALSLGAVGADVEIPNRHLLDLAHAPLCARCDAWHCKRCVYLNKVLTSEVNTPSHEQCVVAHLERDASRMFLETVGAAAGLQGRVAPIPSLDYVDPFDILSDRSLNAADRDNHFADLLSKALENITTGDLLRQVYRLDPTIIVRLKEMNCPVLDPEEDKE